MKSINTVGEFSLKDFLLNPAVLISNIAALLTTINVIGESYKISIFSKYCISAEVLNYFDNYTFVGYIVLLIIAIYAIFAIFVLHRSITILIWSDSSLKTNFVKIKSKIEIFECISFILTLILIICLLVQPNADVFYMNLICFVFFAVWFKFVENRIIISQDRDSFNINNLKQIYLFLSYKLLWLFLYIIIIYAGNQKALELIYEVVTINSGVLMACLYLSSIIFLFIELISTILMPKFWNKIHVKSSSDNINQKFIFDGVNQALKRVFNILTMVVIIIVCILFFIKVFCYNDLKVINDYINNQDILIDCPISVPENVIIKNYSNINNHIVFYENQYEGFASGIYVYEILVSEFINTLLLNNIEIKNIKLPAKAKIKVEHYLQFNNNSGNTKTHATTNSSSIIKQSYENDLFYAKWLINNNFESRNHNYLYIKLNNGVVSILDL